jgi:hypothetical protein
MSKTLDLKHKVRWRVVVFSWLPVVVAGASQGESRLVQVKNPGKKAKSGKAESGKRSELNKGTKSLTAKYTKYAKGSFSV